MKVNFSVAAKLAVSAAWTIGLVVTLSALLRMDVVHLGAADDLAVSAMAGEREVAAAMVAAVKLRVLSKAIPGEQTEQEIKQSLAHVASQSSLLQSHLQAAAAATATNAEAALSKSVDASHVFTANLEKEAGLRRAVLEVRDGAFWNLHDELIVEIGQVRSDLVLEDLPSRDIDNLTAYLSEYQSSVDAIGYGTMSFLATGQAKFVRKTLDAVSVGQARMADIMAVQLTDYTKDELSRLEAKRIVFEGHAGRLLQSIATMDGHLSGDTERTYQSLIGALDDTAKQFAASVTSSYADAAAARSSLLSSNMSLSGAAVMLLVISNLLILHSVVRPTRALTRLMQAMARGDVEAPVLHRGRSDEIGAMMQALEMLRRSVRDAFLQSQMIGQLPIGVMTVDPAQGFGLAYVNPKAYSLLQASGELASASLASLIGRPVDFLQSRRMDEIRNGADLLPSVERILIGRETFDLGISAVSNPDGASGSIMLTLTPRSAQVSLLNRFQGSIARIADGLSRSSVSVRDSAASMRSAAAEGEHKTTAVALATEQASRQMQSISSTVEQLVQSVNQTGAKIEVSFETATNAASQATLADGSVDRLGEAADRIGGIVRLIGEIAGRTKLLALNAAIEAARAGESGRGFAVVAIEVKALASQSAAAAEDVSKQVKAMQATSRQTMDVLKSVAAAIREMSDIASGILGQIGEQDSALHAIVAAVKEVAAGTRDVTADVGSVQRIVSQTGGKAHEVLGSTTALSQQAETLTVEALGFLEAIQAVS